ncbi:Aste57867_24157 [Aphanomyces stellatus]|uniref:Aste57867_24157 protein n=1 Tax=Aphanomyces stellatus TaxID=120398 RepID=A0A485LU03_9STRA|nr:hypothetical protein As57867_024083 [Aphanomyces stellatus]VFU00799.1 Aste57867_24157 [Aphanomyces stellatus]
MKLPLSAEFFPRPPLSSTQVAAIKQIARRTTVELVDHARVTGGPIQWTLSADEKYVKIFKGHDSQAPPGVTSWLAESMVCATLDEIQRMFYCANTAAYKTYIQTFYDEVKDGVKLYDIVTPTSDTPHHFIGVNWVAQVLPAHGFVVKNRDWCFVECQRDCVIDGKRAWVRSFRSIELPDACPNLYDAMGFIRAEHHRSGIVYIETDHPGVLRVLHLSQVYLHGDLMRNLNLLESVVQYGVKRRSKTMATRIERALRAHRLGATPFVLAVPPTTTDGPIGDSTTCTLCCKRFGLLGRRVQCQKCGHVVCRRAKCSALWDVPLQGHVFSRRICTLCSTGGGADALARHERRDASYVIADDDQCSTSTSHETEQSRCFDDAELDKVLMTYSGLDLKLSGQDDDLRFCVT